MCSDQFRARFHCCQLEVAAAVVKHELNARPVLYVTCLSLCACVPMEKDQLSEIANQLNY